MSAHSNHQRIASTLFRCVRGIGLCGCQKPCDQAKKEFEDSFAHSPQQLPLQIYHIGEANDSQS